MVIKLFHVCRNTYEMETLGKKLGITTKAPIEISSPTLVHNEKEDQTFEAMLRKANVSWIITFFKTTKAFHPQLDEEEIKAQLKKYKKKYEDLTSRMSDDATKLNFIENTTPQDLPSAERGNNIILLLLLSSLWLPWFRP